MTKETLQKKHEFKSKRFSSEGQIAIIEPEILLK